MKNIWRITILILLISALSLALFSCGTRAFWQRQGEETQDIETDVAEVNGSEKYIVYAALNSSGNLITHPATGDPDAAAAYAVVGYTGLVAELVIPATYNSLPVTKVLVATPYSDYYCYRDGTTYSGDDARLANNPVVTSIVFGTNVSFVGAGVCAGMVNLTSVRFEKAQANVTCTDAFLGISPTITYAS